MELSFSAFNGFLWKHLRLVHKLVCIDIGILVQILALVIDACNIFLNNMSYLLHTESLKRVYQKVSVVL